MAHKLYSPACPLWAELTDAPVLLQLRRAVEAWEPRLETVPLHAWLHPWLPMLATPLADLYPGIRFKLATALQQWHPSDGSAKELLSPWHQVCVRASDNLKLISVCLPHT